MQLLTASRLLLLASWAVTALSIDGQEPLQSDSGSPSIESSSTKALLKLHKDLITHASISGAEESVGKYLTKYLESKRFTVEVQEVQSNPPRANIFAYVGKTRKTRTLVSSHIDTVPPFWKYERRGDEIWGRGSVDAKGSVASQILAVEDLLASGSIAEGDVGLLYVVGEEVGGEGMRKANDLGLTWDTVIFGEPTELKLASGHKGTMGLQISAKGKAGHSGYPELGKSANAMLIPALHALLSLELPSSEKYGNTTLNIGRMEGGVAGNVIAEDASADILLRIADGSLEDIQKVILETMEELGQELDVRFTGGYGPVYIDSDVPGFQTIVVNYGTDIPHLKGDHKKYLYGPGTIMMAHSDHEHLKVSDLENAVKGYKALIEHSLK
ncbi:c6 zinc finger domain containing protein [Drepanopeziza brunnea f. sp. 'multigermtubi' MB_m1]|uniref:C6 zinc finger domain containing protein n=1 Tax=Marssonina brunnea f. sp. multigermtubi (strain MB_m1) TaxID=1072389 RepID=K1WT69_MARBU|nr:c6 zinc finger domain containing protein [Drepanopeziza brunnea f. sp. 'multigermtubi' MB_m1]EKD15617.1 c6 zinc finger domain containing protein [Drepanopeziza brunnea f. sp. 'multigermtubi' MB_m1]